MVGQHVAVNAATIPIVARQRATPALGGVEIDHTATTVHLQMVRVAEVGMVAGHSRKVRHHDLPDQRVNVRRVCRSRETCFTVATLFANH